MAAHYFVSGIVKTGSPAWFQVMEEKDGRQVCIATVPFNNNINPNQGRIPAMADARMIVDALNAVQS